MENIKSISVMKNVMFAVKGMERQLIDACGVSLKEVLALFAIGDSRITASDIVQCTGLRSSHVSKVTGHLEELGYLERHFGSEDKRKVFFSLKQKGLDCIERVKLHNFEVPGLLRPLFDENE